MFAFAKRIGRNYLLCWVSSQCDSDHVRSLLKSGADPNFMTWQGATPLTLAAKTGQFQTLHALLEAGGDPNLGISRGVRLVFPTSTGQVLQWAAMEPITPLMVAAAFADTDVVELLLGAGADVGFKDETHGFSALSVAAARGKQSVVQPLLDAIEALPDAPRRHSRRQASGKKKVSSLKKLLLDEALMHAAEYGNTETVKSVVASGADTNHRDFSGTALHRAAGNGHTEVVRALLESGANPRSQNGYGGTPAFVAEASGHREIVEVLRAAKGREP